MPAVDAMIKENGWYCPIKEVHGDTRVLARVDGRIVAVRNGNQIGVAFHPELDADTSIHELLISLF